MGLSTVKRNKQVLFTKITAVFLTAMVMGVLGILSLSWIAADKITQHAKNTFSIQIVLSNAFSQEQSSSMLKGLIAEKFTRSARFISKNEAMDEYKLLFPNDDFMDVLDENPMPDLFEVFLYPDYLHSDSLLAIERLIFNQWPIHVESIAYDAPVLQQAGKNMAVFQSFLMGLLLLLGLVMLALNNHSIGLSLYSKRFLIKTMQLVGASGKFIRSPFLKEALWQGFLGGIIGGALTFILAVLLQSYMPFVLDSSFIDYAALVSCILPLFATFLTWLSTRRALKKFLGTKIEQLY
jgi:cell division transport system permease protein